MTRLPDVPAGTRLLPDARLYEVRTGPSTEPVAAFSSMESAVEHIGWMLRNDPMQRVTLDILPPVEVQAPCPVCGVNIMVPLEMARRLLAGTATIRHRPNSGQHWVRDDSISFIQEDT